MAALQRFKLQGQVICSTIQCSTVQGRGRFNPFSVPMVSERLKARLVQRQKFNLGGELPRFDLQPLRSLGWFDKLTLNQ